MDELSKQYLNSYLSTLSDAEKNNIKTINAFHFGDTKECANTCADLAAQGIKKATASLEWCFTVGDEDYPEIDEIDVITNWKHEPICIVKITRIEVRPFGEVEESFAITEGEGDQSLKYWREVHWPFFSQECKALGKQPSEKMPIVLQWFKVVYTERMQST